jgi:hypothetical protein
MSPSKRYLSWSEKAETGIIVVYDLIKGKKKTMNSMEAGSQSYVSINFNPNDENKYLVSLSGGPDWNLIFWDWQKCKSLGNFKIGGTSPLS